MMIRRQTILLIALLIVGCVFSQNLPLQSEIAKMTHTEKTLLYHNMQQDPVENMVRSYLFPTLGHHRINKWERGAKIYFGGLLISVASGIVLDAVFQPTEPSVFIYAMIGGAITHVWQVVDAGKETNKYNRRLYKTIFGTEPPSIGFHFQPTYKGANLSMTYSFK